MAEKTIYLDESGQTGENLLDKDQTHFTLGSTDLSHEEATKLLQNYFPKKSGTDIKFKTLFRKRANDKALIGFAEWVSKKHNRFFVYHVNKRFALLIRMVDWFVEPFVRAQGYDWYEGDYGRKWMNMFFFALNLPGNNEFLEKIVACYDAFCDLPNADTLASMFCYYQTVAESGPEALRPFMGLIADGVGSFHSTMPLIGLSG